MHRTQNLKSGQKIKIQKTTFIVESYVGDKLILKKDSSAISGYPTKITDIGLASVQDIQGSRTETTTENILKLLDKHIGERITIAFVGTDDVIDMKDVELLGIPLSNNETFNVKIDGRRSQIQISDLIDSVDLKQRIQKAQQKYVKDLNDRTETSRPSESDVSGSYDDLLAKALGQRKPSIQEVLNEVNIPAELQDILEHVIQMRKG